MSKIGNNAAGFSQLPALSGHAAAMPRSTMLAPPQVARGFLAGIVRKKLKLNLISERSDDVRVYPVAIVYRQSRSEMLEDKRPAGFQPQRAVHWSRQALCCDRQ